MKCYREGINIQCCHVNQGRGEGGIEATEFGCMSHYIQKKLYVPVSLPKLILQCSQILKFSARHPKCLTYSILTVFQIKDGSQVKDKTAVDLLLNTLKVGKQRMCRDPLLITLVWPFHVP